MSKTGDTSLEAATELGFLTDKQLSKIREKSSESNLPGLEIAIRKGMLDQRQLEVLEAFRAPETVAPGYRIEGLIGQGGAGVVYMATQLGLDRPVALKTISSSSVKKNDLAPKRFQREAKIIGQLEHPNIVSAVDFGVHNEQLYLVMEFVNGIDGEQYLTDQKKMPEAYAWQAARQICHALSYAKDFDVIHRDIKPGNLLLTTPPKGSLVPSKAPFVKIADFGLARFKEPRTDSSITVEGAVSGTPFYMSPEQIGAGELDHRSDIFSLGATIWHLIVGDPPIDGLDPMDVVSARLKLKDDWAEGCPEELSAGGFDLLREMCRFDRDERIGEFSELDSRIETLLQQLATAKTETSAWSKEDIDTDLVENVGSARPNITFIDDLAAFQSADSKSSVLGNLLGGASGSQKANSSSQGSGSWGLATWGKLLAATVLVSTAITYFVWNRPAMPTAKAEHFEQVKLEALTGPPIFMFDGLSVNPTQKFDGTWEVGSGVEKEAILAGNGTRNFKCVDAERQPLEFFQFVCGFRQHESEQIEFRLIDANQQISFKVTITENLISLWVGDRERSTLQLEKYDKDSFGYHNIQIESHPEHWRIAIDSNSLGLVAKKAPSSPNPDTIQLSVTGTGNAHFEQIRFRRFEEKKHAN